MNTYKVNIKLSQKNDGELKLAFNHPVWVETAIQAVELVYSERAAFIKKDAVQDFLNAFSDCVNGLYLNAFKDRYRESAFGVAMSSVKVARLFMIFEAVIDMKVDPTSIAQPNLVQLWEKIIDRDELENYDIMDFTIDQNNVLSYFGSNDFYKEMGSLTSMRKSLSLHDAWDRLAFVDVDEKGEFKKDEDGRFVAYCKHSGEEAFIPILVDKKLIEMIDDPKQYRAPISAPIKYYLLKNR